MDNWQKLKDFLTEGKQNNQKDVFVSRPSVFEEILVIMEELEKRESSELILCKDCKYFEYNSVALVDGIPLIVAHEICKKWGDGCKTNENGYCFLAELKGE